MNLNYTITDVILIQKVLTNTSHVTSCIVMLKDVTKVSLLQKGQNDRINNIVSVFVTHLCMSGTTCHKTLSND
jgi:hypothetical protein